VRSSVNDAMRTLKADLASAARDARTPPPHADSPAGTSGVRSDAEGDSRGTSRARLHEADAALTSFRAELRSELRTQYAAGRLAEDAVVLLISRLDEVRREITSALRR
jgi:hypothetical protein